MPISSIDLFARSAVVRAALLLVAVLCGATLSYSDDNVFKLAPLFTNNAVLQQKTEATFWGKGTPGSRVTVHTTWGRDAAAIVDANGSWSMKVRTPVAGGPYNVQIRHGDVLTTLDNVMVGEVWLCSGQSNMEMPLAGWPPGDTVANAAEEIRNSTIPTIRLFTVKHAFSPSPEFSCSGDWVECSPTTAPQFSATAYFFGKILHDSLEVPIGLIHSSWGGTPVESWMSNDCLAQIDHYRPALKKVEEARSLMPPLLQWLHSFPVIDLNARRGEGRWAGLKFDDDSCSLLQYDDSVWHEMRLPGLWEAAELGDFDGAVWFRKRVEIPASWLNRDLVVELGPIDDVDVTYVNGQRVGSHEGEGMYKTDRVYRIPAGVVRDSTLLIAVRVIDYQGGGGIWGEEKTLGIHPETSSERISLAGTWWYLPVAEYRGDKFFVFGSKGSRYFEHPKLPVGFSAYTATSLFNGMITPLVPFALRGAIWYQGEANTNDPGMYRKLFPLMIGDWRKAFRLPNMPFYYVQIAPYEYGPATPSQYLREAQLQTLSVKNTGMAVTLDIGNAKNIHPANKQEVGRRLARWALAKTYGRNVAYSGPVLKSARTHLNTMELAFDHAGTGLVLRQGTSGSGFQIAGRDRVFKDAQVVVRGKRLIVSNPEVRNPRAVRYAFTNTPEATLFNGDGFPASSFRTDEWQK